jgi:hypothetical protein
VPPFCITNGPVNNQYAAFPYQPPQMPGITNPSWGAEAFLDTMMVNGTVYPTVTLGPQEYRFRILNASHDRFLNLQLYRAVNKNDYTNPTEVVNFTGSRNGACGSKRALPGYLANRWQRRWRTQSEHTGTSLHADRY